MNTIYLATGNDHKAAEFDAIFAASGLPCAVRSARELGGMPEVDENAGTFSGNALIKAHALRALAPADALVLADDSGLCVDALGGAPGVISARYAGVGAGTAANNAKLLAALEGVPPGKRTARFVCVLALLDGAGKETLFEGVCEGRIIGGLTGTGGFGYDPMFIPEGYERTFAELPGAVKNALSHRGQAAAFLLRWLGDLR